MLLLIAAALCTGFVAGADHNSALQAWTTLKYGYSLPGQVLSTLHCHVHLSCLLVGSSWKAMKEQQDGCTAVTSGI